MFSSFKAMILILQRIGRPYQVKMWNNTSSWWMMKFRVLLEETHGILFQEIQLLITMFFQESSPSSARGNLTLLSVNSRHNIVLEGMSRKTVS